MSPQPEKRTAPLGYEWCPKCNGSGRCCLCMIQGAVENCPNCGGTGKVRSGGATPEEATKP